MKLPILSPWLRFETASLAVVPGAAIPLTLDGQPLTMNQTFAIAAGSTLTFGTIAGRGVRSYLCLRGGIAVPEYLGSKSTFTLGQFGGHAGRALRTGDVLHLSELRDARAGEALPDALCSDLPALRELRVIYGPHAAPEYFTAGYIETFFATEWQVHFNSSRTGVRLIGPKPQWVRDSGGVARLLPPNMHANSYSGVPGDFIRGYAAFLVS